MEAVSNRTDLPEQPTARDEQRVAKTIRRAMIRALKRAELPPWHTPHSLRHTFGSLLIAAGVSPVYVQQQMGHASISMTVDTYGFLAAEVRRERPQPGVQAAGAHSGVGSRPVANEVLEASTRP